MIRAARTRLVHLTAMLSKEAAIVDPTVSVSVPAIIWALTASVDPVQPSAPTMSMSIPVAVMDPASVNLPTGVPPVKTETAQSRVIMGEFVAGMGRVSV